MISRKFLMFRFFVLIALLIAEIVLLIVEAPAVWWQVLWILILYVTLWHTYCSACPHCGKRFYTGLTFNPFRRDAGYCNHCGKQVKYKELADQGEYDDE